MTIKIKRAWYQPADNDGYRVLIDRMWPRGMRKEQALVFAAGDTKFNNAVALKEYLEGRRE